MRVVALDGPAGSGKTTVARRVAEVLGWRFVDTGATYRAVTLAALRAGVATSAASELAELAARTDLRISVDPRSPGVFLGTEDVSREIRGPAVTAAVSEVSSVPEVRAHLIDLQRRAMGTAGAVVEGRDIATVVAPRAALKVYLDARPEVRAARRSLDHVGASLVPDSAGLTAVQADLARRDARDNQTNRLTASDGAVHLDTSDLTLEEVVSAVVELARTARIADTSAEEASS